MLSQGWRQAGVSGGVNQGKSTKMMIFEPKPGFSLIFLDFTSRYPRPAADPATPLIINNHFMKKLTPEALRSTRGRHKHPWGRGERQISKNHDFGSKFIIFDDFPSILLLANPYLPPTRTKNNYFMNKFTPVALQSNRGRYNHS